MPVNSMPSPATRAVCSPIRRSRSAGTIRAWAGGGCGKTSSVPARSSRSACQPPPQRHRTRTSPAVRRPHAVGRTTQLASAREPCSVTCVALPDTWSTPPGSSRLKAISSRTCGDTRVTVSSTSSPSKQRDAEYGGCYLQPSRGAAAADDRERRHGGGGEEQQAAAASHQGGCHRNQGHGGETPQSRRRPPADRPAAHHPALGTGTSARISPTTSSLVT